MAKIKMVSTNKMDKVINKLGDYVGSTNTITFDIGEDQPVEIVVTKVLPFDKFAQLVTDIVDQCFEVRGNNKVYYACKKEFVFKTAVIEAYTNIKTDINQEKLYHLVNCKQLYEEIVSNIDTAQWDNLIDSVCEQIEFENRALITNYEKQFEKAIKEFEVVTNSLKSFNDIDFNNLNEVISKLDGLSPNKIAEILKPELKKD